MRGTFVSSLQVQPVLIAIALFFSFDLSFGQTKKLRPLHIALANHSVSMFLAKHNLAAHRDVAFIQIGGMPEIATALSKKIIAAAPMSYPMVYVAEQGGAKILANLAKDEIPFVHLTLTTTKRFLKEKRPLVKAFLRAYGKAVHFLYTRQPESLAIFAKYTKIKDQKMLEGSLKFGYEFM